MNISVGLVHAGRVLMSTCVCACVCVCVCACACACVRVVFGPVSL